MRENFELALGDWLLTFNPGDDIAAVFMLISFYIAIRLFRSPFGMMLRAVTSNPRRMNYTGLNSRPYALAALVISGMYANRADVIEYMENIVSNIDDGILHQWFAFLPDGVENAVVVVVHSFIGKPRNLTLWLLLMLVVIFLPGDPVEGGQRISRVGCRREIMVTSVKSDAASQQEHLE